MFLCLCFFFSDTLIVMCFGFVQMWTSVKLRIPAFKPVLTPMALSSAAVTRDMNLRKMAFIAVVMGLALTLSTCSESWGWVKGFVAGVSSHFLVVCLVGDISQSPGNTTTQRTEVSHFLRDGVQAYLPDHLTFNAKSAETLSGSEMELVRGRTHPISPVGQRVVCLFAAQTLGLKMV